MFVLTEKEVIKFIAQCSFNTIQYTLRHRDGLKMVEANGIARKTIVRCGNAARFSKGLYVCEFLSFILFCFAALRGRKETNTAVCDYWQKYKRTNMNPTIATMN